MERRLTLVDTVAAFDFDGTLAHHDAALPFLRSYAGGPRYVAAMSAQVPFLFANALRGIGNSAAKDGLLHQSIACRPLDGPAFTGTRFLEQRLAQVLRSAGIRQIVEHQRRDHGLEKFFAAWRRCCYRCKIR